MSGLVFHPFESRVPRALGFVASEWRIENREPRMENSSAAENKIKTNELFLIAYENCICLVAPCDSPMRFFGRFLSRLFSVFGSSLFSFCRGRNLKILLYSRCAVLCFLAFVVLFAFWRRSFRLFLLFLPHLNIFCF